MWTLSGLNLGVQVVLLALPLHRRRAPCNNAFMAENSAGETPLMHLILNDYPPDIVHAVCLRGGGFSTREWESGAVMRLLTHRVDIETLVDPMLYFFRSDFLYRLQQHRVEHGEGALQTYCRHCEEPALSDVRILVETLGEDPQGASEILGQHAESHTTEIQRAVAYLDECTARSVRPRTAI